MILHANDNSRTCINGHFKRLELLPLSLEILLTVKYTALSSANSPTCGDMFFEQVIKVKQEQYWSKARTLGNRRRQNNNILYNNLIVSSHFI